MSAPDPKIPNTGRILDHWLGGSHHFPVDAAAAAAFDRIYGEFPRVFRVLRGFIGRAARYIERQGLDQFLVLGAGIPTQGNVHEAVPGAKVLYTDIDPLNVELGQQILAGAQRAAYAHCDATDLTSLDRATRERVLGPPRKLGIIAVGVSVFLSDDELKRLFSGLYDLAPAGSYLAFDLDSTQLSRYPAALQLLGGGFHMRTPETFAPLLGRWSLVEPGIVPVAAWGAQNANEDLPTFMFGGVARKP